MTARYAFGYAFALALVAFPPGGSQVCRWLGSMLLGVMGAKAFELAHEALHLHFTGNPQLDRSIAYLALLPTLKPLAPTVYGHVQRHHRYTNIKGYDTQWSPASVREYAAFSPSRRLLERIYRSVWGLGLYWSFEVVLRYHTPNGMRLSESVRPRPADRGAFLFDRCLVYFYIAVHFVVWPWLAAATGSSAFALLAHGFILPLLLSHWLLGAVTYLQHTSPEVRWVEAPSSWSFYEAQVAGTVDVLPASRIAELSFSSQRPHGAHHIDMNVPVYGLREAQDAVDAAYPGASPKRRLTLAAFLETVSKCQLYDFDEDRWTTFADRDAAKQTS